MVDLRQHLHEPWVIFPLQALSLVEKCCWIVNGCSGMARLDERTQSHAYQCRP